MQRKSEGQSPWQPGFPRPITDNPTRILGAGLTAMIQTDSSASSRRSGTASRVKARNR